MGRQACSSGRTASASIATAFSGSPTAAAATATASRSSSSRATGKLLMTLGTKGVSGDGPDTFNGPTDVAVAPNGDIFVSDGHVNSRIVKFSKDGKFIKSVGQEGHRPRRVQPAAHDLLRLARPAARRRSLEQAHPDLRSGRQRSSISGRSSARRAASSSRRTTRSTSSTTTTRCGCSSAARRTDRSSTPSTT